MGRWLQDKSRKLQNKSGGSENLMETASKFFRRFTSVNSCPWKMESFLSRKSLFPLHLVFIAVQPYIRIIDIWPDNWAVSPWHAGRTFRTLPNIDEPEREGVLLHGPFAHVHI